VSKNERQFQNSRAASRRACEDPAPDGSMRFWRMHQLWELAEALPVKKVRLSELEGFDEVRWFGGPRNIRPTPRAIAEHARDIYESDLSYPIILSPTGEVLDGWHRICKAYLEGVEELDAVQLLTLPLYRWRLLATGEEVEIEEQS
jgi:hypothetical protein